MKFLPLILANLGRSPLRSFLTAAAIALAIALVCLLRTLPEGLEWILDYASSGTRVVVLNKAGFEFPLPYAYLGRVHARPGVVSAVSWTWYGGRVDFEEGETFPSFATEAGSIAEVFPEFALSAETVAAFASRRDSALVGLPNMQSYGWKVGDRVTLRSSVYPVDLEFQIVGVIESELSPLFLFHREYLVQSLEAVGGALDSASLFYVRVDDRARIDSLRAEIDALFRNSPAQTLSETEKAYFKNLLSALDGFVTLTIAVTVLVALCIVFIAANTSSLSVRERAAELAVLKALGFGKRLVFTLLVVEAAVLAIAGGAVGAFGSLLLTLGLRGAAASLMPQLGPLGGFVVTRAIVIQGLFLALFVGMLSGVVPSFGAARRSVAATLREVF